MNLTIKTQKEKRLYSPNDLPDGSIGVIKRWTNNTHIGTIVQKYKGGLIAIGQTSGNSWTEISSLSDTVVCAIELLEVGDTITIVQ